MWFGDVDLPSEIVDAHRRGSLVLFIGAGASIGSGLPSFRKLTQEIIHAARRDPELSEEPIKHQSDDVVLGRLKDEYGVDVHQQVEDRIGVATSKPNDLHRAIVELAHSSPKPRIVTTNYDLHLSTAAEEADIEFPEFVGPALPVGDDFEGLVYLHGNLRHASRHLVVTDSDFGRAYLRDAWATRFLERMFSVFTVLFVGYSHGDVVMRYLARGLGGRGNQRYIMTPNPVSTDWRQLAIQPIGYEVVGDSHHQLVTAIQRWASRASMGLLGHRQQIAELVSTPPSGIPEEESYLESVIGNPDQVGFFCDFARGEQWLTWAASRPEFRALFVREPSGTDPQVRRHLAYWFAEHYVLEAKELSETALQVVEEAGGTLGPDVRSAIEHELHRQAGERYRWLAPWIALLVDHADNRSGDWLEYALHRSTGEEHTETALLLFDHLTEPHASASSGFALLRPITIGGRGDPHELAEAWTQVLQPQLDRLAPAVLAIVDRHLRRARWLTLQLDTENPATDLLALRRSAIEPHEQDHSRETMDVLIDAGRDAIEALLEQRSPVASAYVASWLESDVPLLQRLGIHGWTKRQDVAPDEKLDRLRAESWLFDPYLHHESFQLLEQVLPHASPESIGRLVDHVTSGFPGLEDPRHRAYEQHRTLCWIDRHHAELPRVRDALNRLRAEHPDLHEPEHPDFLMWAEVIPYKPNEPMTVEKLVQKLRDNPQQLLDELLRYQDQQSPWKGTTWGDVRSLISRACREQPHLGLEFLEAGADGDPALISPVIQGWSDAELPEELAAEIAQRIRGLDLSHLVDDVSRLLDGGRSDIHPTRWHTIPAARQLARDLWDQIEEEEPVDAHDWLQAAINTSTGRTSTFWLRAVAHDWQANPDDWNGLPPELREALDTLLDSGDTRTHMAQVIVASQLHFLFAADRRWTTERVLPLFDWREDTAQRAWEGFLFWGRWNDQLLEGGLLDGYVETARRVERLPDEHRHQLTAHLAGILLNSQLDLSGWVRDLTGASSPEMTASWIEQTVWELGQLPPGAAEHAWDRWLKDYWRDRVSGVPRQLSLEEASALAGWAIYLDASIPEAVELATARQAQILQHSAILYRLVKERSEVVTQHPAAIGRLLAHLLRHTQGQFEFGKCNQLSKLFPLLRSGAGPDDLASIVNEAFRLGCRGAAEW